MSTGEKTLVLAGAREAHGVVAGLKARNRNVVASLPEPERMFGPLPVPTRVGRFADAGALKAWLTKEGIDRVIDTSHGFDDEVSLSAARACAALALPYLRVLRPVWAPTGLDRWSHFASVRAAVEAVQPGARVFSNTGRNTLRDYEGFRGDILFMRQTHPVDAPPPFPLMEFVSGTPPFSLIQEEALFRDLKITRLICRNVGGAASMSKILAARRLGIRVLMIDRPAAPPGVPVVEVVAEALAWEADG
jgi:precorrin-6A/cobalt-precorrin-6A reductase